jgi:hypothetical protein
MTDVAADLHVRLPNEIRAELEKIAEREDRTLTG